MSGDYLLLPAFGAFWIALVILLSAVSELAGVLGQVVGVWRRYDGPMGKSDRAFVFGALALLLGVGLAPGIWLDVVLLVLVGLLLVTIGKRIRNAIREAHP